MKRYYVKERTLARGRGVSMGIDVHKESWQPGRIPSPDRQNLPTPFAQGCNFGSWAPLL
jgi:hypothetical protein